MKPLTLLAASLAVSAGIAAAQTPTTTGSTSTSNGPLPYIPLIPTTNAHTPITTTGTGSVSSTWYIDTTRNLVVLCAQQGPASTSGAAASTSSAPTFTCTAQAVPTTASSGTSGSSTPATGSGASGSGSSGGAGSNPMGG